MGMLGYKVNDFVVRFGRRPVRLAVLAHSGHPGADGRKSDDYIGLHVAGSGIGNDCGVIPPAERVGAGVELHHLRLLGLLDETGQSALEHHWLHGNENGASPCLHRRSRRPLGPRAP